MGSEDGIPDLTDGVRIPVLQDVPEAGVAACFGASKWYIYIIDAAGIPKTIFYSLNLDSERERLLSAIRDARSGK